MILDQKATWDYVVGSLSICGSDHPDLGARVRRSMAWYRDLVAQHDQTVPFCLVHDVGHLLLDQWHFPFWRGAGHADPVRSAYVNSFLAVLLRDDSFRQACEAIATDPSRDDLVARTISMVLQGVRSDDDVELNPSVVRSMAMGARLDPQDAAQRWSAHVGRPRAHAQEMDRILETLVRRLARHVLAPEDVDEVQHWSAYRRKAQRMAGRRIARFVAEIGPFDRRRLRPTPETGPETDVQDAGTWAEGGITGITTKGAIESLVPTEVAYMGEETGVPGLDLFAFRHVQQELLYYERDQSQLQKLRRVVRLVFAPDAGFRVKAPTHADSLEVALLGTIVRLAADVEGVFPEDALNVHVHMVDAGSPARVREDAALLEVLMGRQVRRGTVSVSVEQPGFQVDQLGPERMFPAEERARVCWVGFQFLDQPVVGVPMQVQRQGRAPCIVVAKVGGAQPSRGRRPRGSAIVVHLPLERSPDDMEPAPLEQVAADARDEVMVEVASPG